MQSPDPESASQMRIRIKGSSLNADLLRFGSETLILIYVYRCVIQKNLLDLMLEMHDQRKYNI